MMKPLRILYFSLIAILTICAIFYIGWGRALIGTWMGLLFFATLFMIKFVAPEKPVAPKDERWGFFVGIAYIGVTFASITYFNYAMIFLYRYGLDKEGTITSVRSEIQSIGSGSHQWPTMAYYCKVNIFDREIPCSREEKKGDHVFLLYSPKLPHTPPVLYHTLKPRVKVLLEHGGTVFMASVVFVVSLLEVWFFSLYRKGYPLVLAKIRLEKDKEIKQEIEAGEEEDKVHGRKRWIPDILYHAYYIVSFSIFVLFVVALLKNLYLNVPFKFWSIGLTTLALIFLLVTDWGEKMFAFSNNIMFSLKHYRWLAYIKQAFKVLLFVSFGRMLYESIVHVDKSFLNVLMEFLNKFFDINLKGILNLF